MWLVCGLAATAAYAAWASGTKSFTVPADIGVSVPSALFVGDLVLERRRPSSLPWRRLPAERPAHDGSAVPWLAVVALLVAVELASYLHSGPRTDYPTISSGLNALFVYRPVKAAGFFTWLTVGWFLARR